MPHPYTPYVYSRVKKSMMLLISFSLPKTHSHHFASIDMRQPYTRTSSLEVGVPNVKYCLKMANKKMSRKFHAGTLIFLTPLDREVKCDVFKF